MDELWAAWHPNYGFSDPYDYEGPVAFADLDSCALRVKTLNADAGTNARTSWRAVKVTIEKVTG